MAIPASLATSTAILLAVVVLTGGCGGDPRDGGAGRTPTPTTSVSGASQAPSPTDGALPTRVSDGVWAGEQAILTVTPGGATAEFACASGAVKEPLLLDPAGRFDVAGSYEAHPGGPESSGAPTPTSMRARYRGRLIDSTHLNLAVELSPSGTREGPFRLELGGAQSLERCV